MQKSEPNVDLQIEILGILGNLDVPNFDFFKLVTTHDLISFISAKLSLHINNEVHDDEDDDILLQVIIFLGLVSFDERVVELIAQTNIIEKLCEIMDGKLHINSQLKRRTMK